MADSRCTWPHCRCEVTSEGPICQFEPRGAIWLTDNGQTTVTVEPYTNAGPASSTAGVRVSHNQTFSEKTP